MALRFQKDRQRGSLPWKPNLERVSRCFCAYAEPGFLFLPPSLPPALSSLALCLPRSSVFYPHRKCCVSAIPGGERAPRSRTRGAHTCRCTADGPERLPLVGLRASVIPEAISPPPAWMTSPWGYKALVFPHGPQGISDLALPCVPGQAHHTSRHGAYRSGQDRGPHGPRLCLATENP